MNDVLMLLIVFCTAIFFITFLAAVLPDHGKSKGPLYVAAVCIFIILVSWGFLRNNILPENYIIDKEVIFTDILEIGSHELKFNKELKLEITIFDMPFGTLGDYRTYRIFFDSLTYVDLYTSSFDSLDLIAGKKLYKEE